MIEELAKISSSFAQRRNRFIITHIFDLRQGIVLSTAGFCVCGCL